MQLIPIAGSATIAVCTGSRNAAANPTTASSTQAMTHPAVMTRMAWRKPAISSRPFHSAALAGSPPVWKWRATKTISGRRPSSEARQASPNTPNAGAALTYEDDLL